MLRVILCAAGAIAVTVGMYHIDHIDSNDLVAKPKNNGISINLSR